MKKMVSIIIIALLFPACGMAIKMAAPDKDTSAKSLIPPEGKALIYVVRPGWVGKPFAHEVTCNGKKIGSTCGGYYIYTITDPGKQLFATSADNNAELEVTVDIGKIYYIEQTIYPGLIKGIISLSLLDPIDGKKKLDECSLSEENIASQ